MSEPNHLITDKNYLAPLEGWRGFVSLLVVGYHFSLLFFHTTLTPYGYLGVDFFFILSGFIISRQYEAGIAHHEVDLNIFFIRRVARLYPLYIISIGLYVLVHLYVIMPLHRVVDIDVGMGPIFLYHLFLQLLMLGNIGGMSEPWNGPAWSVSVEWVVNLLYFSMVWRFRRVPNQLLWACIVVCTIYLIDVSPHTLDLVIASTPIFNPTVARGITGFALGALLFRYHKRLPDMHAGYLLLAEIALMAVTVGLLGVSEDAFVISRDYAFQLVIFPALIAVSLYRKSLLGWFFSLWQWRFLGRISYSIYLLHFPLGYTMEYVPRIHELGFPWLGGYYLIALIALSTLSYFLIEVPGRMIGNVITQRLKPRPAQVF